MCKTAYSYIRFSTPKQAEGDSYRRQITATEKLVKQKGWKLSDFRITDLGISAFKGNNATEGELSAFIEGINKGKIDKGSVLIVESLDRLSRQSVNKGMQLFLNIINSGIDIFTTIDSKHFSENNDNLFFDLQYSMMSFARANEESETKSKRVKEAWQKKRDKIREMKYSGILPSWLRWDEENECFEIIHDKAEIVREVFKLYDKGTGPTAICNKMNKAGIPTLSERQNSIWRRVHVQRLLRDKKVIGEFQPHHMKDGKRVKIGDVVENYFPAIIERDLFLSVQDRMNKNKLHHVKTRNKEGNLFTNLVWIDGEKAETVARRDANFVFQKPKTNPENWVEKLIYAKAFEQAFLTFVDVINFEEIFADDEAETIESEITRQNTEIKTLGNRKKEIEDLMVNSKMDISALYTSILKIDEQIEGIKHDINQLEHKRDSKDNIIAGQSLQGLNVDMSIEENRRIVKSKIHKIVKRINVVETRLYSKFVFCVIEFANGKTKHFGYLEYQSSFYCMYEEYKSSFDFIYEEYQGEKEYDLWVTLDGAMNRALRHPKCLILDWASRYQHSNIKGLFQWLINYELMNTKMADKFLKPSERNNILTRMRADGVIVNVKRGVFRLSDDYKVSIESWGYMTRIMKRERRETWMNGKNVSLQEMAELHKLKKAYKAPYRKP